MYQFNLQVVLDYRKRMEERMEIEFSHIKKALEKKKQMLLSSQTEKHRIEQELMHREEKRIDVNEAILYRDYLRGMRKRISEQRECVASTKKECDAKREELVAATKKKKVLEKVKDNDLKRFLQEAKRRERILIDEMGTRKYKRTL